MPRPDSFDDASIADEAIDALLAGSPAAGESAALAAFVEEVRAAVGAVPTPSPVLAAAIAAGGISTHSSEAQPPSVAQWRKFPMKLKGFLAGLGIAGKLALGVGVAAAATTGAGAAGVLPGSVQHAVANAVGAVTPFSLPDGDHPGSHDGNLATGDTTTTTTAGDVTTTTVTGGVQEPEKHHSDVVVVVTPTTEAEHHDNGTVPGNGVTPTTVAEHHNDNTGSGDGNDTTTPTTITEHHDENTTPTTEHHDGDHNNPQAITLSCSNSADPASITCTWTASPNADHDHYLVLRTHDGDPHGRAFFPSAGAFSYTDTVVTPGAPSYTYLVDSLRADGSVDAHSNRVTVQLDGPTTTTTVEAGNH